MSEEKQTKFVCNNCGSNHIVQAIRGTAIFDVPNGDFLEISNEKETWLQCANCDSHDIREIGVF